MKTSVCIIDDDSLYKLLLKKSINKLLLEIEVKCYNNGMEALNAFAKNKDNPDLLPDIILLDINMPIMDGWEFLDAYIDMNWQFSKKMNIYMASSSIATQDIEKSKQYHEINDYLVKPITAEKLNEIFIANQSITN